MEFINFLETKLATLKPGSLDTKHPLGHEIDEFADKNPQGIKGFVETLGTWAKAHPGKILTVLHALRPVLNIKNVTVVTSFEGVKQILGNDSDFAVTYGPKMDMITQGAGFFLGSDDAETKGFMARTNMQMLFRRDDVQTLVRPMIDKLGQAKLATLQPGFDLVADYLKFLPAEFAIGYFGFQMVNPEWLYRVTAGLFEYLFIDVTNNPVITKNAEGFAEELRAKLDAEIALGTAPAESVLGRGQALHRAGIAGFDAVGLRNNMLGLLIGLVPTTAKSAAMAYDYACHSDACVSSDGHNYKIPAGNMIFVGTYTAMRDKQNLPDPLQIIPGRPDSAYLTYGYGLHACFGRYINDLHVAALLYNCFKAGHMVRADGPEGDLHFDGAFPSHLKLKSQ